MALEEKESDFEVDKGVLKKYLGKGGNVVIPNVVKSIGDNAFIFCSKLTNITIPNSVESIGKKAFLNCSSLQSITIPNSVTNIGGKAFAGCNKLTSITIPNSVTSIGEMAFRDCSLITSVTIGDSLKSIGDGVFSNCKSLTSVSMPNSVTSIGDNAFQSCSSLTNITIPNSVKSIGNWAFYDCKSLASITIPNNVTSIGNWAFYNCSSITSVIIPKSVTTIGERAFRDCSLIASVTIGDSVESIGEGAFSNCKSLTSVAIPNSVMSIGSFAFEDCSSLTSIIVDENNQNYKSIDGNLYSKDGKTLIQYAIGKKDTSFAIQNNVTSIENYAFRGCSCLTEVIISNSVTSIGDGAFYSCRSLRGVTIPNSVTSIGSDVFNSYCYLKISCSRKVANILKESYPKYEYFISNNLLQNSVQGTNINLLDFKINKGVVEKYLGNGGDVVIPNVLKSIGERAFLGCRSIKSIVIPNSITSIGERVFEDCSSLTSITIGNGVKSIGNWAFYNCRSITSVTIPKSVKSIGERAFSGCTSLKSITISNGVKGIRDDAFSGCNKLTSITIPKSLKLIGSGAFFYCCSLTSIIVDENNQNYKSIDGNLYGKNGKTLIQYATGKKDTSFTIPNSVTSIGDDAFSYCTSLTNITIPDSVTSIGEDVFTSCSLLKKIICSQKVVDILKKSYPKYKYCISNTLPQNSVKGADRGLSDFEINKGVLKKYLGKGGNVVIPNGVASIGDDVFSNCRSLKSITIPNSVTSIGIGTFSSSLTSIIVDENNQNYKSIDGNLYGKDGKTLIQYATGKKDMSFTIPNSVTSIGDKAFYFCSLTNITIPDSVTSIGEHVFTSCSLLKKIICSQEVADILKESYPQCEYCISNILPQNSVQETNINLSDFEIDKGVLKKYLGNGGNVVIPNIVKDIGAFAFDGCSFITNITIPNSVKNIGAYAFDGCDSLQYSEYDNGLYLGNSNNPYLVLVKARNEDIKSCEINNNCKIILHNTFFCCHYLANITIPNSVTILGDRVFFACSSLTSINIISSSLEVGKLFYNDEDKMANKDCDIDFKNLTIKCSKEVAKKIKQDYGGFFCKIKFERM